MNGKIGGLFIVLLTLGMASLANAQPKKGLTFGVGLGGMNVGTFSSMNISTHSVGLSNNDVMVSVRSNAIGPPIKLSSGKIAAFSLKILTPKVGQQMTVTIEVLPFGVAPGQRCTFNLEHAYLDGVTATELTVRPSSVPTFKCSGRKG